MSKHTLDKHAIFVTWEYAYWQSKGFWIPSVWKLSQTLDFSDNV